jgi:mono/diheme cytochrome c family protein
MKALFLLISAMTIAAPTLAADALSRGQGLTEQICVTCHITQDARSGSDMIAPLTEIVNERRKSAASQRAFLTTPHGAMPDLHLTRRQVDDLVVYLESLRNR